MPTYDYKCEQCGYTGELVVTIGEMDKPQPCPRCSSSKAYLRQFTPTLAIHCNLEGGQNVQKHARQMTEKVKKRQRSTGYGPTVEADKAKTAPKQPELTPKQLASKMRDVAKGRKPT